MYSREMRIGATSDLHGILPEIEPCELFFICGDIMPLSVQLNMPASLEWLKTEFIPWANNLPCKHVIFIAGNHDFWFERNGGMEPEIYETFNKPTDGKLVYLHHKMWDYDYEVKLESSLNLESLELRTVRSSVIGHLCESRRHYRIDIPIFP